jgi:hypothetical protein
MPKHLYRYYDANGNCTEKQVKEPPWIALILDSHDDPDFECTLSTPFGTKATSVGYDAGQGDGINPGSISDTASKMSQKGIDAWVAMHSRENIKREWYFFNTYDEDNLETFDPEIAHVDQVEKRKFVWRMLARFFPSEQALMDKCKPGDTLTFLSELIKGKYDVTRRQADKDYNALTTFERNSHESVTKMLERF